MDKRASLPPAEYRGASMPRIGFSLPEDSSWGMVVPGEGIIAVASRSKAWSTIIANLSTS